MNVVYAVGSGEILKTLSKDKQKILKLKNVRLMNLDWIINHFQRQREKLIKEIKKFEESY